MVHSDTPPPSEGGSSADPHVQGHDIDPFELWQLADARLVEGRPGPIGLAVAHEPPSGPQGGEPSEQPVTAPPPAAEVPGETANPGSQTNPDVEALSIRPAGLSGLQVSTSSKAHAIVAESAAKFIASGLHFGLARQFTEAAFGSFLTHMASNHPTAKAILDTPRAQAAITAVVTAPVLAASHHVGEVHIRALVLNVLGAQVAPTNAAIAFPDDMAAQDRMRAQQSAGRIGKAPADLLGLASFVFAHGIRGALGGTTPLAASLTSGIAGGAMAAAHSLLNLNTHTEDSHGTYDAPTHHVHAGGVKSMRDLGNVISESFKKIAGNGPIKDQVANTLQDVFGSRGVAALQGLLIANLVKAQMTDSQTGSDPSVAQKFGQTSAATIALLGLGFFANLSLAERRGKTSEPMSGTIRAVKSLDPSGSAKDGGMLALMEAKNTGVGARAWNAVLYAVDVAAHTGKTLQTLPGHVVLDTLTLASRGVKWMTGAGGLERAQTLQILEDANRSGRPYGREHARNPGRGRA
jgi:hypothetical protein